MTQDLLHDSQDEPLDPDGLLHDHPDDPPLYAGICIHYIDKIHSGSIKPGQLLPPAWRVAEEHGVSRSTARRSLKLLSTLGWAKRIPGYPYMALMPGRPFVATNSKTA
jgi:DNA-binding transcriptional MocR family regulator